MSTCLLGISTGPVASSNLLFPIAMGWIIYEKNLALGIK